ncbi:subtilisin family serine protease/PKD repeat protein [Catalinimonas alkaloidigena]|uniref:S8 family serine peptidase n=1 Tax=Catalinimonas alkaloidigena TaxID=1075417 RepID=UPI0024067994|nr:S8 family serine peptidase [Catalinimonas alkaloidigena]MDF9798379.1 subtilisin family serine protease/PKD repeat protein [Catalinimonas alkaloidigena]
MGFFIRLSIGVCGLLMMHSMCFAQHIREFSWPEGITANDYAPHTLIVKFRDTYSSAKAFNARQPAPDHHLDEIASLLPIQSIESAVPSAYLSHAQSQKAREVTTQVHLENIYKIHLQEGQDLNEAIQRLLQLENVAYAEPYYLLKPLGTHAGEYVPNDPGAAKSGGAQDYLSLINAYEAWAIEKGDSSIRIGILDTGIEFGHQDLADNLWENKLDPINGIDDDEDGLTDNYLGWDFADNDNDPTADQNIHGIQVTGIASGTTDNKIGISGAGFNSSYVPIKIFRTADGSFHQGYEAIAYAANMGCKVINLSWGGANAFSNFGQDMIDYAVLEKDVVVVAAAGNSGKFEDFYPASFNHVLSVTHTDANDQHRSVTTTSYFVDLAAPGNNIYTTRDDDAYANSGGSSMAAPQVAGTAALLRAHYPELNALQIMEKIRLSTDDIYDVGSNKQHLEKMGRGRLNMGKALNAFETPALRMSAFTYRNHVGAYAFYGDTLNIEAVFTNYLSQTSADAKVTLTSPSAYVSMLDSVFTIGTLDTLESVHSGSIHSGSIHSGSIQSGENAFSLYLHEDLPGNEQIYFRLVFEDDGYTDYQYFYIVSSSDEPLLDNGKIRLSIGSNGDIGKGISNHGFVYQGDTLAKHIGLMIGTSNDSLSDNTIQDFTDVSYSQDFEKTENIRFDHSSEADIVLSSVFNDQGAENPINLSVEQRWLTNTSGDGQKYLISEYRMINGGPDSLFNLMSAMFADWDIGNASQNKASWDMSSLLGYVYDDNTYSGIALLSGQSPIYRAIDKLNANNNVADLEGPFSDSVRYSWISQGISKAEAGVNGSGNDVAHMVGAELDTLPPTQHQYVAFALLSASSLAELQELTQAAQAQYIDYRNNPAVSETIYACVDSTVVVQPSDSGLYRFYKDALGTVLLTEDSSFTTSVLAGDTSIYLAKIDEGYESPISQVQIKILQPQASFRLKSVNLGTYEQDTLFLNSENLATLRWEDTSTDAVSWHWNFGNGFESSKQHPSVQYQEEGEYDISLRVLSSAGCESIKLKTLTVVRRVPKPIVEDQVICYGSPASISASNTDQLKVYRDKLLDHLLYSGDSFTTDPLINDSVYYIVNNASSYPSTAVPVNIRVIQPKVDIKHSLSLSKASKYLLKFWPNDVDATELTDLIWEINGVVVGTSDTLIYDYSAEHENEENIYVSLTYTAEDETTCEHKVSKQLVLKKSPKPQLKVQQVCSGESVNLSPSNGEVFYFYEDSSLQEPIHKGKSLNVGELNMDKTYYITNIDSLKESEVSPIQVIINKFADFNISSDTVYLSEGREVVFQGIALKEEATNISWTWDLGDGQLINRGERVSQQYDSMGVYQIRLIARNSEGCSNIISKLLTVINVTSTEGNPEDVNLRIYPNPTGGIFWLSNVLWYNKEIMLHLYDRQGKALCEEKLKYSRSPLEVNLHELSQQQLPNGLYFIELRSADKRFIRKLMIQNGL